MRSGAQARGTAGRAHVGRRPSARRRPFYHLWSKCTCKAQPNSGAAISNQSLRAVFVQFSCSDGPVPSECIANGSVRRRTPAQAPAPEPHTPTCQDHGKGSGEQGNAAGNTFYKFVVKERAGFPFILRRAERHHTTVGQGHRLHARGQPAAAPPKSQPIRTAPPPQYHTKAHDNTPNDTIQFKIRRQFGPRGLQGSRSTAGSADGPFWGRGMWHRSLWWTECPAARRPYTARVAAHSLCRAQPHTTATPQATGHRDRQHSTGHGRVAGGRCTGGVQTSQSQSADSFASR
jgi:hypothetical protein